MRTSDGIEMSAIKHYEGSTVLISGGAGFIGSALVDALSNICCQIILLLRPGRSFSTIPNASAKIVTVHGDIRKRQTWAGSLDGVDYVFHLAAQTSGYVANNDPLADLDANVVPVLEMMEACRQGGLKPAILYSGTVTEMGLPQRVPVDESAQDLPVTVYDIHKLTGEKYLQFYSREADIPAVTLRLANVYGPGRNVGSGDRGVLNLMVKNALNNKPLTVYGDGSNTRDYIFIDDVVSAFLVAGVRASDLKGSYYLIGSGEGTRIVDAFNLVADRVKHKTGISPAVEHIPSPDSLSSIEDRDFIADTSAFRSATSWAPQVPLAEGIDRIIEHLVSQQKTYTLRLPR